ncbi:MAG: YdcF family protein, partial [Brevundimonas sp.]
MRGLIALLVVAAIWASGLLAFAARVDRSTPAPEPQAADGIVALTGAGSNARIGAAMELLEDGKAQRMLVSGVNREASRE